MSKKLKRPIAFIATLAMVCSMLLYLPGGVMTDIGFGLAVSAEDATGTTSGEGNTPADTGTTGGTDETPDNTDGTGETPDNTDGTGETPDNTDGTGETPDNTDSGEDSTDEPAAVESESVMLLAEGAADFTPSQPTAGDGSSTNPYQISNANELYWFAGLVNGTLDGVTQNTAAWAKLTANITVNNNVLVYGALNTTNSGSFTSWTPIGNKSNQYTGKFDGNGHTISGIVINKSGEDYQGLFGYSTGTIMNVGVIDSSISGRYYVGGVCGRNEGGTITNCYSTGTVSGSDWVGGVCGYNNGGTIKNCYSTGAVSGSSYVGGVCGRNEDGTIDNCYSTGTVTGSGDYVGGVCGRNGSTIKNCYSTGAVSGKANVGGVCGYNSRTIENCYSTGTVSAAGDYVGGVCGYNVGGTIKNCYSTGAVSGASVWVGGVCGYNSGTIENCYNIGAVSGASGYVGGVCGYNYNGTIKNCYYDTDFYTGNAIGKSTGGETNVPGKTTADLCGSLDDLGFDSTVWTAGSYSAVGKKATATFPQPKVFENTSAPKTTLSLYNFGTNGSTDWKPYTEISTAEALQNINNNLSGNYVLTADITLTAPTTESDSNWTPIGSGAGFTGKFSGDGHTISGIVIKTTSNYQGLLFGYSTGTIMNVGVIDSSISGKEFVGGVCGQNDGTIKNCYSTGTVSGSWYVGGVCGRNKGTITNCYSTGAVSGTVDYVGGVCGRNEGTITNCYSTGEVSGSSYVGGVCGMNYYSTITNCYYDTDFYTGNAIGSVSGTVTNVTGKTTAELCGSLPAGFDSAVWNVGSAGSVTATVGNYGKKTYTSPSLKGVGSAFTLEVNVYNFGTNGSDDWDTYTKISTAEALQNINNNLSGNYVLTADITLTAPAQGGSNWTAIGTSSTKFTGKFDGNGHTISGIVINKSDENDQGLFGYSTGLIMNVGVLDSSISGGNSVGGVCGWNEGTITNCYSTGAVSGTGVDVGGVCGYNYCGTIKNCYSTGAVSGSSYVGGVCGFNYCGTIKNCYSTGTVSGENVVGGVCGQNNSDGTIKNCYYNADFYTGNAIGYNSGTANNVTGISTAELCGTLSDLGFYNDVWTDGSYSADGKKATATLPQLKVFENTSAPKTTLSLYNFGTNGSDDWDTYTEISTAEELQNINNNLSGNYVLTADITLTAPATESDSNWTAIGTYSAPFTGKFDGKGNTISGIVINSTTDEKGLFGYSSGLIMNVGVINSSISGGGFVGGVCGYNYGTIENCFSTGAVSGTDNNVGGVCGKNNGIIENCYSTGAVSGTRTVGGVCGDNYGTIENCYSTGTVSGSENVGGVCGYNDNGTITNCYYDTDFYTGNAIGRGTGTANNVTGKTTAQFASGEVAYLLQSGQTADENGTIPEVWGQDLSTTTNYPVLGGAKVYKTTPCVSYSNENVTVKEHTDNNNDNRCDSCNETYTFIVETVSSAEGGDVSSVANLDGGGNIKNGESTTITASAVPGYTFNGWYEGETKLSADLSFVFTPTADVTLTAKYTANAKMTVTINGGTSYSVSVNGGTASDYSTSTSPSYEVGTKLTVTAKGENFAYWQNEASSVLSRNAEYTFTVVNNATVTAVYNTPAANKAIVNFISGYDQIINRYQIGADGEFTVPAAPTKTGCDFAGWSINGAAAITENVADAVKAAITAALATESTADDIINVKATYTAKEQKVTVTVNSGSGSGEYNVNDVVTVTANAPESGYKFSHWTDGSGTILSYNTSYSFYAAKNITVEAVYVADTVEVEAVGTTEIVDVIKDTANGKISFVSMSTVPEGCTIVKAGIVATSDSGKSSDLTDANADYVRGNSWNGYAYRYNWTKKNATGITWYVRAYLVYTDKNGNTHTLYGNLVTETL